MTIVPKSLRVRVFLGGVVGSVSLIAVFFGFALTALARTRGGNLVGIGLVRLFEWTNPLLALLNWIGERVWGPAPHGSTQTVLIVATIVLFVGWWWLVALVVDRIARTRRLAAGAA
jgi:hypothetical protein